MTDIYADENEPSVKMTGSETHYKIEADGIAIQFTVEDETGLAHLQHARWVGRNDDRTAILRGPYSLPKDQERLDFIQAVWTYLQEWELVELKAIGPEDSEYFATQNLNIRARLGK